MRRLIKKFLIPKPKYSESMFIGEHGQLHKKLTEYALDIARDGYDANLNFTHSSIEDVEKILADIHRHYCETGETDGLRGIAFEFGSYIAATIQKTTKQGVLKRDDTSFGEASFPFHWRGTKLFPCGWCEKRIFDGSCDNVLTKYKVLVLEKVLESDNIQGST